MTLPWEARKRPPRPALPRQPRLCSEHQVHVAGWLGQAPPPLGEGASQTKPVKCFYKTTRVSTLFCVNQNSNTHPRLAAEATVPGCPPPAPHATAQTQQGQLLAHGPKQGMGQLLAGGPLPRNPAGWLAAGGGSPHPAHTVNPPRQPVLVPQNRSPPAARLSAPTSAGLPNWSPSRLCPRRKRRSWSCWSPSWSCWR